MNGEAGRVLQLLVVQSLEAPMSSTDLHRGASGRATPCPIRCLATSFSRCTWIEHITGFEHAQ